MINSLDGLLTGKQAVITGANRGIGLAISLLFLQHGARVYGCIRNLNSVHENEALKPYLEVGQFIAIELDLSSEESVKIATKSVRQYTKQVDILVNNAGIASGAVFQMTSINDMKALFDVNLFHPMLLTQGIARLMSRAGGAIVNISSSTAQSIEPGTFAYGSSKAAVERATKSLALELAVMNIRVNAIAPGITQTEMAGEMDEAAKSLLVGKSAMKRCAAPADIANTALFLCSDLARHITGQVLSVDGGLI
ncbi:SDR family NAD(P)-dependent oxidoreductase [Pseudoalteromonas fenneropenaei]|uniref:SDR family NAD(P)-dependent oxidoreductase n=1 Tax=Pseudoalteromonas fenneropenaei TaxID=1737459 RepID=A0ABV7CGQ3_9GAMM